MTTVPLRLKLLGFLVLAIMGFSLVGTILEMVKQVQAEQARGPVLIREQFAASLGDPNASADPENSFVSGLKFVCPFH